MSFYDTLLNNLHHMLILGPTGTGKSKLVETLMRHLALRYDKPSLVLLDPGAATAEQITRFITRTHLEERSVILDPQEPDFYLAFNPLKPDPKLPLSLQAKYIQEAILTALEIDQQDSIYFMPVLEQVLYNLAHLLMETGYTLAESEHLLAPDPRGEAVAIVEAAKTPAVHHFWKGLQGLKPRERQQLLGLPAARLLPFLVSPVVRRMISQNNKALDFSQFIEQGGIFIANLQSYSTLTPQDAKLLANLLISSVVRACFSRPPYTGREVFLFIEECGEGLIGTEIGKMLRKARKHRLRVILLNQDLSSMREESPVVFRQIWANTTHKVAFGDLPHEDLDLLALELFGQELDLKTIKDQIYRTFFEPKESERTIYSSGSGFSRARGAGSGSSMGSAEAFTEEGFFLPLRETLRMIESEGQTSSSFETEGDFETETETTVPFYEFLKQKELSSREFYALEELLHLAKVRLKALGPREIAFKQRGKRVKLLRVPFTPDIPHLDTYLNRARHRIFQQSGCYATIEEVEAEQEQRTQQLSSSEDIIIE